MSDRRVPVVLTAVVALLGALTIAASSVSAASTPTTMVPGCSGINIRAGTSTASPVKVSLAASATLTEIATMTRPPRTNVMTATVGDALARN